MPWYVLLLRAYFSALPRELIDAAKLDGAGEWRIFFQIVVPLSRPALATVALFCALAYWNDWCLRRLPARALRVDERVVSCGCRTCSASRATYRSSSQKRAAISS
jgi:ABC-type glycerol-3-phosphate transport system permease component